MKPRLILVSLGLAVLAIWSLGLQAQTQPKAPSTQDKDEIITSEQQLLRQFAEFQDALLKLKQRMARGTPEERKRAEVLDKVLEECNNLAVRQEFLKMIELMRGAKINNTSDIKIVQEQSDTIATKLRKLLDQLQDSKYDNTKEQQKKLAEFIKDLEKLIAKEQTGKALNELGKTDKKELTDIEKKNLQDNAKLKDGLDKLLDKDPKKGQGGEAKNPNGENKDGGKEGGAKGEAKNDGKNDKGAKGEAKNDGAKDPKEASKAPKGETKPGQDKGQPSKSGDGGEPKAGSKPGEPGKDGAPPASSKKDKGGDKGEQGAAKENKGDKSDKKEGGAKDSGDKNPDPKKDAGSAKGDDKKAGGEASKPSSSPDSKAKAGGEGKPGGGGPEPKVVPSKESKGDDKAGEGKSGDAKGGSGKQGETKPGDSKSGQGQAKEGGASPDGAGGGSPPPPSAKGDGAPPPPSAGGPPKKGDDDIAKAVKKLQEAGYDQQAAADAIPKDQKEIALKKQADAIQKMEDAKKKLEKLLQQMREEEIERVLAALLARCEKMLIMQQQVLLGTRDTDASIKKSADKKPTRQDKLESLKLSDKEKEIVQEANKCIDILEAEGTAVAFPEVFQQIRQDMIHVQKRLEVADVHDVTQAIEEDIITSLKEMILALKKAQDDNQPDPGKPGAPGKAGKPADPKLLELVQELKMVRALQKRVNDRTNTYGKRFDGLEQASDPQIVRELRNLADRQLRIQEIVRRIANGDNK